MMKPKLIAACALAGGLALTGCGGGEENADSSSDRNQKGYLAISDGSVREGNDTASVRLQITLSNTQSEAVSVDFSTRDGTAIAGEDYAAQQGTVTIPPGSRRGSLEISIIGDTIHEPDEYFEVILSNPQNAFLSSSDARATVTIRNDDEPPRVSFDDRQQSVSETVGSTRVGLRLSDQSGYTVKARLSISGTALLGDDFSLETPVEVVFEPGITEAEVDVQILQDNIPEGGETINFAVESITDAAGPGRDDTAEHTIIILGDTTLNDTGMVTYSDGATATLRIEPSSHPGQDASFGRDAEFHPDYDGHAGFSFTKLDVDGNPMPSNVTSWACTRDNVTGAVWENKQPAQSLAPLIDSESGALTPPRVDLENFRASNFRYAWRVDDSRSNGGDPGHSESIGQRLGKDNPIAYESPVQGNCGYGADTGRRNNLFCNTKSYLNEMNRLGTCGFNDWRMPTIEELRSIGTYKADRGTSAPETNFFSGIEDTARYLSGTPSADNAASVWCYDFAAGEVKLCQKTPNQYRGFMAVRSRQ